MVNIWGIRQKMKTNQVFIPILSTRFKKFYVCYHDPINRQKHISVVDLYIHVFYLELAGNDLILGECCSKYYLLILAMSAKVFCWFLILIFVAVMWIDFIVDEFIEMKH